jgi:hypothetical protein
MIVLERAVEERPVRLEMAERFKQRTTKTGFWGQERGSHGTFIANPEAEIPKLRGLSIICHLDSTRIGS